MKSFPIVLLVIISLSINAQSITHGPIVGAVTDSSCRVFVRTSASTTVTVELSTTNTFSSIAASTNGVSDAAKDMAAIFDLAGLSANTTYYVRASISGTPGTEVASFKTFQSANTAAHQVFITGSSINNLTDGDSALFVRAKAENATAFIEMGDWGYPDANGGIDIYFTNPPTSWAKTYNNVRDLYKQRYVSPSHASFLRSLAVDYVYDDHDYLNVAAAKDAVSGYTINPFQGPALGSPEVWNQPVDARLNSIKGYQEWFPGYKIVDSTEGIYHSFRSANVEFFVLDMRSMRTPQVVAYNNVSGQWIFNPGPTYTLLGTNQMNWLKNGLANSTATWKIIVSSDAFNVGAVYIVDSLLHRGAGSVPYWAPSIQNAALPNVGYTAIQNFIDNWAGFRGDADSLISYVTGNNINNVFVISAGPPTVGLDDGTNSGLPELNSGNLKKVNSQDWFQFQKYMGFSIWDKGGSGLCEETNFNTTYGRLEVFGNDSIRLSAVDATGAEVCGSNFKANQPYLYNPNYIPSRIPTAVNDTASVFSDTSVIISVTANDRDPENDTLYVSIKTNPLNGTVQVNGNNTITYSPRPDFVGKDTFYYHSCDRPNADCSHCSSAMAVINVTADTMHVDTTHLGVNSIGVAIIRVYPNPANSTLLVQVINTDNTYNFDLCNILGQKLLERRIAGTVALDISKFPAGNYLYSLHGDENELIKRGKLQVIR